MNMPKRESPGDLWCVTHLAGQTLEELFDADRLARLEQMALYKTIGVLRRQTNPEYAVAGSDDLAELVLYVRDNIASWRGFVALRDLPKAYHGYRGVLAKQVLAEARAMLLLRAIGNIPPWQLWHHQGQGYGRWQAAQSLIDQYRPLQRAVWRLPAPKGTVKFDDRHYHGRPKRDRTNGTPEGVSTGRGPHSQRH